MVGIHWLRQVEQDVGLPLQGGQKGPLVQNLLDVQFDVSAGVAVIAPIAKGRPTDAASFCR